MGLFNRFFSPGTWDNWLVCFSDLPLSVKSVGQPAREHDPPDQGAQNYI